MEYKKSIIILILTIFLFSIASVCASDANDTAIASEDTTPIKIAQSDEISVNDDNQAIGQSNNEEKISEGNVGTFSQLQTNISATTSGTLELDRNYEYDDGFDTSGIKIDNSITIDGKGYTIDAKGKARVFNIQASDVTIKNLVITNANYNGDGGAVRFDESGRVINCNFTNNKAGTRNGGAVYFGESGRVINCNFTNNKAVDRDGGAVYFEGHSTVTNCNFTNNIARNGGAIQFSTRGNVTNCNFANNQAVYSGGAIRLYSSTVENCNFTNNTSSNYGGAIRLDDGGTVTNCNFMDNNANTGSAIYFMNYLGTRTISNSCLLNNRANVDIDTPLQVTVNENNVAITFIGRNNLINAIYSDIGVSFTNVTYWGANGIANTDYSYPSLSNREAGQNITIIMTFNGAVVLNATKVTDENGTIVLDATVPGIYNITALHEEDTYYTRAETTKTIIVTSKWSELCKEIASGQNITLKYSHYTYDFGGTINITNACVINGNGAVIDMAGSNIQAFNIIASGVTIKNMTIKNANHTGDGGAIYFKEYGSVENCNFVNNTAKNSGGAIGFATNGNVENCNFTDNKAGDWGGSIYFERTGTVTNCNFTNNTANALGGAVLFIRAGNVTNCSFDDNSASKLGGAVYFSRDGEVTNCSFTNNNANSNGGAIYFAEDSATSVMNCKFSNNTADDGGAIFSQRGHTTVDTCIFKTGNDTINSNVIILAPTLNVDNFTSYYNSGGKLTFDLKTNSSMPVNGNISISVYYKNNGSWVGNYSCLSGEGWTVVLQAGSYYALFNTKYAGFELINRTITVNKVKTQLTAKAVTATYNVNKYLVITLKDSNGKPLTGIKVTVNLNGAKKYTTDKNGQFKVATKGLAPKKYTAKITFNGNTNYVKSTKSVKVTVKKATPKLTAKKKTFKVKKAKKYTITLKTNKKKALKKGKVTLTVKVKGKKIKITKKTNKKGKATFNLKKLNKKGRYTAVVKFAGNKYYKAKTVKAKITIR